MPTWLTIRLLGDHLQVGPSLLSLCFYIHRSFIIIILKGTEPVSGGNVRPEPWTHALCAVPEVRPLYVYLGATPLPSALGTCLLCCCCIRGEITPLLCPEPHPARAPCAVLEARPL